MTGGYERSTPPPPPDASDPAEEVLVIEVVPAASSREPDEATTAEASELGVSAEAAEQPAEPVPALTETRWSARDRTRERELLALVASLPPEDPRRVAARDQIVTMHLPLAAFLARRFRDRGESLDDLTQVATIGLLKAVDRFEPERGVEFSTFATPTVVGEIKRHFRDKGWAIRVPRRLQELRLAITRATAELSQSSGRSPTVAELAAHLGVSEDDILEGLESAQAYATLSLDAAASSDGSDEGASLVDTLGKDDAALQEVETRATVDPLLAGLPPRERRIVEMRFYENLTQSQIAERVGVSQMHVSRLLAKSLAQMRTTLVTADQEP
ncbi:MAG TPA: RNA polymerase sigma factor SigF [Candidatus Nanopelagicales bacterium]